MDLTFIHGRLATTSAFFFFVLSVWAFIRYFRKQGPDSSYWGALVIGEILIVAQAIIGAYLWFDGARPPREMHILYGILLPAIIPAIYANTKGSDERRSNLIYGAVILFAVGLIIRAISTGLDPLPVLN